MFSIDEQYRSCRRPFEGFPFVRVFLEQWAGTRRVCVYVHDVMRDALTIREVEPPV